MSRRTIHRPDHTRAATVPNISQSVTELPSSSRAAASNLCERYSPMTRAIIAAAWRACGSARFRGLAHVFHAELLHLAGQGIAAPAQELGRILLHAVGLAQRHADQDALDLGHGLIEQALRARRQFLLGPMRQLGHPIMIRGVARRHAANHDWMA